MANTKKVEDARLIRHPEPTVEELYPEHMKLQAVKDKSQAIGEFLAWLKDERKPGLLLCFEDDEMYHPAYPRTESILAEFFDVDEDKLEEEKRAMLKDLQVANNA